MEQTANHSPSTSYLLETVHSQDEYSEPGSEMKWRMKQMKQMDGEYIT